MGWIWLVGVVGLLLGAGLLADRRRYRGMSILDGLSGREKRRAVRQARGDMARKDTGIPQGTYDYGVGPTE